MPEEQDAPFLGNKLVRFNLDPNPDCRPSTKSFHAHFFLGLNLVILCCNVLWTGLNLNLCRVDSHYSIKSSLPSSTFSPARSSLVYTVQPLNAGHPSAFTSDNRQKVNEAWSDLLRSSMIRLSREEVESMNKTSIALRDGSGYIGYMEAIHMLHCVKRMDQYRFQHDYPELANTEAFTNGHWKHCLEILRQGIMCNADVTINTYAWESDSYIKGFRKGSRKCTDWSKISDWLDKRALPVDSHESFLNTLVPDDG